MKKVKDHTIYCINNCMKDGQFIFINFKPTKQEIKEISQAEWLYNDDQWKESSQYVFCHKIDLWGRK